MLNNYFSKVLSIIFKKNQKQKNIGTNFSKLFIQYEIYISYDFRHISYIQEKSLGHWVSIVYLDLQNI